MARLPVPNELPDVLQRIVRACVSLKRLLSARDPTERSFSGIATITQSSLTGAAHSAVAQSNTLAMFLHSLEGISQRMSAASFGVAADDLRGVVFETGTPAAWHPLLPEYDVLPDAPEYVELPPELLTSVAHQPRQSLAAHKLADLKKRLRILYEAGPGTATGTAELEEFPSDEAENEDEDEDGFVSGAKIPVPAETFLEELCQKLEVHPLSVLRLSQELGEL